MNTETIARLPPHVQALLTPAAYDHPAGEIELIQTHLSYVVIAGDHVYKLKKALDLGFVDFRTLDQRRRNCLEEVRLNSRTCASLYYGVVSITRSGAGYHLDGPGEVVDYAVHMRRLPEERTLASLVETGGVTFAMLGRLAWKVARFHAAAEDGPRARAIGGVETMTQNWDSNLAELVPFVGRTLTESQLESIRTYGNGFVHGSRSLFERREDEGRIREGHGDLRADAVAFDESAPDGVCLFDCLEFSERFRYSDTGLDVAFLAMDLERRGRRDFCDLFLSLYTAAAGDKTLPLVTRFFRCYRALIRGKVAGILLDQAEVSETQRAAAAVDARSHFALAASYARPNAPPAVVLVMGLTGTGKSVVAGALANRIGAVYLSTDITRKEVAGLSPWTHVPSGVGTGLYTSDLTAAVYVEMLRQARRFLDEGRAVVLDGTYLTRDLRAPVLRLAARRGVPFRLIECQAPEEAVRSRQELRVNEPWTASDATWDVYLSQKERYEPPAEVPADRRSAIDTTRELTGVLDQLESALGATA